MVLYQQKFADKITRPRVPSVRDVSSECCTPLLTVFGEVSVAVLNLARKSVTSESSSTPRLNSVADFLLDMLLYLTEQE